MCIRDRFIDGIAPRAWEPDENATATINYTSGTTARPKGVQLTHRNLWTNAMTFALHAGVTDRDVYLHTLPMFHANGWGMPFAMAGMGVPQAVSYTHLDVYNRQPAELPCRPWRTASPSRWRGTSAACAGRRPGR